MRAAITAVAGYLPDDVLTNADLEKMVDTNDEWIRSSHGNPRTPILKTPPRPHRTWVQAVKELLEKRGIDATEVDLIICATVTADMHFPATANLIADKVGAVNSWGYDLSAACSGFIFALTTGAKFVESGQYKKVVIVGADKMSSIIDYTDRTT